jgi:tetratricopeptide (TPR) repeat protein
MVIHAKTDIAEGEEIGLNYLGEIPLDQRQATFQGMYGFTCHCPLCEEEIHDPNRRWLNTRCSEGATLLNQVGDLARENELTVSLVQKVKGVYGGKLPKSDLLGDLIAGLGKGYLVLKQYARAIPAYLDALVVSETFPRTARVHLGLAHSYLQLNRKQQANEQLTAAFELVREHTGWDFDTFCLAYVGTDQEEVIRKLVKRPH